MSRREFVGRACRAVAAMPVRVQVMRAVLVALALATGLAILLTGSAPVLLVIAFALAVFGLAIAAIEIVLLATERTAQDQEEERW